MEKACNQNNFSVASISRLQTHLNEIRRNTNGGANRQDVVPVSCVQCTSRAQLSELFCNGDCDKVLPINRFSKVQRRNRDEAVSISLLHCMTLIVLNALLITLWHRSASNAQRHARPSSRTIMVLTHSSPMVTTSQTLMTRMIFQVTTSIPTCLLSSMCPR